MANWADVHVLAVALPEVTADRTYRSARAWKLRNRSIAWERPLSGKDRLQVGDQAWAGDILGVRVVDLEAKDELLTGEPGVCFTIPHFDGYPAVLVRLERVGSPLLDELLADAWRASATTTLRRAHPQI